MSNVLTHTHTFPYIFVQAMSCPIATALLHNVLFIKRKDCQMYIHTHTHTISLIFSFKPCLVPYLLHYCIMFSSERKKNVKFTYTLEVYRSSASGSASADIRMNFDIRILIRIRKISCGCYADIANSKRIIFSYS